MVEFFRIGDLDNKSEADNVVCKNNSIILFTYIKEIKITYKFYFTFPVND